VGKESRDLLGRGRPKRVIIVLVVVLAASLAGVSSAHGAFGDVTFEACITGKDSVISPGGPCADNGTSTLTASDSGYSSLTAVAVSNDGRSVYAAALGDDAIARFSRNPSTGELTYDSCLSGDTDLELDPSNPDDDVCDLVPTASSSGTNSGLNEISDIAVSPDDESVYVTAQNDDAVAHFDRDTSTGSLSWVGCITGKTEAGLAGSGACADSGTAESGGTNSGLDGPQALAVTGNSVYAVAQDDTAIVRFNRNPTDPTDPTDPPLGELTYVGCGSKETETAVGGGGTAACAALAIATSGGANSGMDSVSSIDLSPNGESVYVAAFNDHAVTRFARGPAGALTYDECITGEEATGPMPDGNGACESNGTVEPNGLNSGLQSVAQVAVGPDNTSVYATAESGVARFAFDDGTDDVTFEDCITGEDATPDHPVCTEIPTAQQFATNSGLRDASGIVISLDGKSLYTTSGSAGLMGGSADDAIAQFDRDSDTGVLTYRNCITGELASGPEPDGTGACAENPSISTDGVGSGLDGLDDIAATSDGKSIYGVAFGDASVFQLHRENPPDTTIDSGHNGTIADNTPTFNFSSPEPVVSFASFECSVDAVVVPCSVPASSHTTSVLPDGAHSFSVRAFDTFGFPDPDPPSNSFTVDTTAPETTINSGPAAGSTTNDATPSFGFSSSEANSTFACRADGDAFQACNSGSFTAGANLSEGAHTFDVIATDQVGNADPTAATRSFTVDAIAEPPPPPPGDGGDGGGDGNGDGNGGDTDDPNTSIKKKPKKTVKTDDNRVRVTFRFKSDEKGSEFDCKLDKRKWKGCESPKKYKVDEGNHTFKVRATDDAGNTDGTPAKFKWTVKETK
jgi:hypothetical protein